MLPLVNWTLLPSVCDLLLILTGEENNTLLWAIVPLLPYCHREHVLPT